LQINKVSIEEYFDQKISHCL